MVFEYLEFDLTSLIQRHPDVLTPDVVRCYMFQLVEAFNHMHEKKIMHRDAKTANILIDRKHNLKVRRRQERERLRGEKDESLLIYFIHHIFCICLLSHLSYILNTLFLHYF